MATKKVTIQLKRGLKANLASATTLLAGEPAYTTDTRELFVGDGAGNAIPVGGVLPNTGTPGTYKSVTTDAQGRVTGGTNPTTLSGFGITDAAPSSHLNSTNGHPVATKDADGFMSKKDKETLDALQTTGGQPNVIESVKVAGATLPVTAKSVDVPQATATVQGVSLLGAANGAARFGQKADAGLGSVDNVQQVPMTQRGAANGVATLDTNSKVPTSQLPDVVLGAMLYGGTFAPGTKVATLTANGKTRLGTTAATITLTNDSAATTGFAANQGIFYLASAAGSFAGVTAPFEVGDWLVSTGASWQKIDNTDAVVSVNGKTGAVSLTAADVNAEPAFASLPDAKIASASAWNAKQGAITSIVGNDNASAANNVTSGAVTVPVPVTVTAPAASATQQAAGTTALRAVIQTLLNNTSYLFANAIFANDAIDGGTF